MTEKFWKVLPYNVIPVVLNGANMSNIAPKNSYIDFKDFNNSIAGTVRKGAIKSVSPFYKCELHRKVFTIFVYNFNYRKPCKKILDIFTNQTTRAPKIIPEMIISISETAKYLLKVSEDAALFASHFWWRDFYLPTQSLEATAWCSLCSALHNDSLAQSVITDLHSWWQQGANCHSV